MMNNLFNNDAAEDRITFDHIYRQYHKVVYANIFKLIKDASIADDIFQEVFFSLWENRLKMNTDKSVPGWLFVVSYNKSMSYLKKKVKESVQFVESYDSYHSVAEEIFPDKALYEAQLNILEEAVNALSPQKQKVFRLCRFEGKSQEEAAQILGLSIESVKVYLKQSKFFIKEYMTSRHSMDGLIGISILFILTNL